MDNNIKPKRISFSEPNDGSGKSLDTSFTAPTFKDDDFVLYYHPLHYYSQKVLFILYEKQIDFVPYAIDLANGEQYSEWFLKLNPKGEVPVLQDGNYILPDSTEIIAYLEKKFKGGKFHSKPSTDCDRYPFNLPAGSRVNQQDFQYYDRLIGKLPVGALTLGSLIHEDLKLTPKPPFVGSMRQNCLVKNDKIYEMLKKSLEDTNNAANKMALIKKLDLQERRKRLVYSSFEFHKLLDVVTQVLMQVEAQLQKQQAAGNEWCLCTDYTLVDVNLGLLLHRLYQLGFENYFWTYGKMPHVESYFLRFKKRQAYQKLMPTHFEMLKDFWQNTPSNLKLGAGFIGMAMFAAFAHK